MEQLFDFLTRLGEVVVGIIAAVLILILLFGLLIELIDWLIVDPIKRARQTESPEEDTKPATKQINLPQSGAPRDVR